MGTIYIAVIMVMRVVQTVCGKSASGLLPKSVSGNTKYFTLTQFAAAALALAVICANRNFSKIDVPTLVISFFSGIALTASSVLGLYAMKSGTVVLNSMFGTGGLLVPCIAGIFLFGEHMSVLQWVGIALFFAASYLLIDSSKQIYPAFSVKTVLILIGSLLANGLTMLFQKMFAYAVPDGSVAMFSFLTFAIPGVLMLAALLLQPKAQKGADDRLSGNLILFGLLNAAAVFVINQLATAASGSIPSAVLFTFINGGGTVIAAVVAAVMFRERLSLKSVVGIVVGVAALVVVKAG